MAATDGPRGRFVVKVTRPTWEGGDPRALVCDRDCTQVYTFAPITPALRSLLAGSFKAYAWAEFQASGALWLTGRAPAQDW